MRDLGFGVLQTARLRSSSPGSLFSGGAYRPYAAGAAAAAAPSPSTTPFGPLSPPPLPVTGFSEAASPFPIPFGCGGADSSVATASSSSPFPAHQQTMQDELLLRLTQQPARPLSGAEATEKLPNHHPGSGTNAGVTHLLPSQDFKPSLHHPSSSASSCCCCRTSSPQDFSKRQQQQLSSQKRKEFSPPRLPHPPDSKPPPPLHCPGRSASRTRFFFGGPFSAAAVPPPPPPAMNLPQQQQPPPPAAPQQPQSRRSPVSPQLQQQHQAAAAAFLQQRNSYNHHQPLLKQSPWSNHQSGGWGTGSMSWGAMHGRDHRRTGNMGIPGTMNQISPLKKPFSGNVIAPPKFTRSTPSLTPKSWIEDNVFRTDNNSNTLLPLQVRSSLQLPAWGSDSLQDSWCTAAGTSRIDQDRSRMYDSLNMHSLENSLIDIMRAEHDPLKGRLSYPHPGTDNLLMLNARSYGRRRGRSSLFPIDDGLLDDGHNDQVGVLNSPTCYSAHQNGERIERFSRKVFVGGLPPDIDEDEITASFRRFGPLVVDWPHKAESKSYFPPKGYAFLLFQEESSVQALIDACIEEDGKLYLCVSSPTIKDKPVQIRPWNLSDSDFVMDGSQPLDPRKTIFVGGVPRPLRAVELAMIMDRLYGGVCYAGIDTDPELKYPKGAGRVAFSNQQSYIAAISARFVQLQHGDIDKRVEVKPYVLDDQMCDECQGARCGGKFAPFFCANVTCLQYYCEFCWANIHSRAGREFHKPLVKEGADRPRQIHFRWN
ncbi:cytoplasmic polyadenylation element-binding protein 2 isoform X6 [Neophocaena asiaeorientalis asiaeorientalis]|uniref:Cytoplasmic polyadenylation element-binding protein 2 isoform X6 n=1 Tax=Neophocaena asiaeorientalis asiaeorientalis TaxID=1706337 RepID=A0A341B5U9_NEOAA|nr:cytoplasmic polyadenylation element-binding protein 2 isoform X6 [Neophocaena asiaeorientalis asiaeorientalis]